MNPNDILTIGQKVHWLRDTIPCEGIVKDDQGNYALILCTKAGKKSRCKEYKISKNKIIVKMAEQDILKTIKLTKYNKLSSEELIEKLDKDEITEKDKPYVFEVLVTKKNIPAQELVPYGYEAVVEEVEDEEIEEVESTNTPKVVYEAELTEEEKALEEKGKSKEKEEEYTVHKTKKGDILYIDPKILKIENGFNTRIDYGDLEELKMSIIENGVRNPLSGYEEDGEYYVIDGHRRHTATLQAIKEGNDIARVPFIVGEKGTLEQRLINILISNDGKQLTSLELGETYLKLINYGYNYSEIAKKIGKTVRHVSTMVNVAKSDNEIKKSINDGHISATLVSEIQEKIKDKQKASEVIKEKLKAKQEEAGEDSKENVKITRKDLRNDLEKELDQSKSKSHKDVDDIKENKDDGKNKTISKVSEAKTLLLEWLETCNEDTSKELIENTRNWLNK